MSLCAMFAFQGVDDPNILHCTHKFFPDDSQVTQGQIIKTLEAYFKEKPFKPIKVRFDQLQALGTNGDYRALSTNSKDRLLLDLKDRLDLLEADQWPDYLPHVTVGRNTDEIDAPIRDYVLMNDHKIVWSAVGKRLARLSLEKETRGDLEQTGGQKLDDFNAALDAVGTGPRKKSPAEMMMRPSDYLDESDAASVQRQRSLTDTWQVAEGSGPHDFSINDNDSKNGPVR